MNISYNGLFTYMKKYNISKNKLSSTTGISRNTITKMENGEPVHLSVIMAICETYDLEMGDIVRLEKERARN